MPPPSSPSPSPLWPAPLHHLALQSPEPGRLADFLSSALGMRCEPGPGGSATLTGPARLVVVEPGPAPAAVHVAYGVEDRGRLDALRDRLVRRGVEARSGDSPFFEAGGFRVGLPGSDGAPLLFGVPADSSASPSPDHGDGPGAGLPGRLQHVVFRTPDPEPLLAFLVDAVGFVLSDRVEDDEHALTAGFVRSDPEHHSLAAFRASRAAFDHFALEADGWNDLRDWGDHFAALRIPIWWGPGRHGPGNNLFLMIRDPDGNRIEISAEMERMAFDAGHRVWPLEERTLNLWGNAWMRN